MKFDRAKKFHASILVVDDALEVTTLLSRVLQKQDHKVHVANTTEEARAILLVQEIDLILLDVNLPDEDGYSFCREIRDIDKLQNIPILFLTSDESDEALTKAYENGGDDYLRKPFNKTELLAKIQVFLRIKNLQDTLIQDRDSNSKEFQYANRVYNQILPRKSFETNIAKVESLLSPLYPVGGDFVDSWESENGLYFLIADCSGHGPSAALIGAMIKMTVMVQDKSLHLKERVADLRTNISKALPEDFSITFIYGFIDSSKKLSFINGGHPSPILFRGDTSKSLLGTSPMIINFPIAGDDIIVEHQLQDKDQLLFFTDGITESMDVNFEVFGEKKLEVAFRKIKSENSELLSILTEVLQEVDNFISPGKREDDMGLLIIQT